MKYIWAKLARRQSNKSSLSFKRLGGIAAIIGVTVLTAHFITQPKIVAADTSGAISNPISFTDNFNNGFTGGWAVLNDGTINGPSNWVISNGQLLQTSNIYGGSLAAASIAKPGTDYVTGNADWANYNYTVTMGSSDNDDMGVVFRYKDRNNYYRFSMDSQNKYMRLVKKVNGTYTLLAQTAIGYTPGQSYDVRVLAQGSDLQIFVAGTRIFDVTDTSLKAGKIGLYTWGDMGTHFDNVAVQAEDDDYFSIAVLPDIQNETEYHPSMLNDETNWIDSHRSSFNIAMVLGEGDIVNHRDSPGEWTTAKTYLSRFDGTLPFVLAAGNHDLYKFGTGIAAPYPVDATNYNNFISSFSDYPISGQYQPNNYQNTYTLFSAGGVDMLVLNLEFGAPNDVLNWAGQIADMYPSRHVIMLTHDYLGANAVIRGNPGDIDLPTSYNPALNNPNVIWSNFVNLHKNIQMTLNGHVIPTAGSAEPWLSGEATAGTAAGGTVFQMVANYQNYESGDGYFRMLKFYPSEDKVVVTTYSPYINTHLLDGQNQFTLYGVDMSTWPTTVATNTAKLKSAPKATNAKIPLLTPQQAAGE